MAWLLSQTSCHLSVLPHQDNYDGDEEEVEGGEGEDDRVLPVELEDILLPLLPLLSLLTLETLEQAKGQAGAGGRVTGLIRRTGVCRRAEALTRLVIPDTTFLEAGGGGLGVLALAAAGLLPPLLVCRSTA